MSWKLPKAPPKKHKKLPEAPTLPPEDEVEGITGQYIWFRGRWAWCRYPEKR